MATQREDPIRIRFGDNSKQIVPPTQNYHYVEERGWIFAYQTVKDINPARDTNHPMPDNPDDRPWLAFMMKPVGKGARAGASAEHVIVRSRWFAKRSSAQRAATKWRDSHLRTVERQTKRRLEGYIPPSQLCPKCEEEKVRPDYYLCRSCS